MRSIHLLMTSCVLFLATGCATPEPVIEILPPTEAAFCDVEEPRRFSQEELDWRSANAPWNVRRDFKTNDTWDRECETAIASAE
jgi:hypothetical protein